MTPDDLRKAGEAAVRRLARYCEVENWETQNWLVLIDVLMWKNIVRRPCSRSGYY